MSGHKSILVLGCGPSGLIAAEACKREGHRVSIIAVKQKSVMPGAQYLHERIPGITQYEPMGYVCIRKTGTAEGYAKKVYGDRDHPVSWERYEEGYVPAWHLGETYNLLWGKWAQYITDAKVESQDIAVMANHYDLILSTIPAPILCRSGCKFGGQKVLFTSHAQPGCDDDTIIYNGDERTGWYRTSSLFGHGSTEYAMHIPEADGTLTALRGFTRGFKPTGTTCECPPANVRRIGRFGKWDKQVLVHHAWEDAKDALLQLQ